MASQDQSRADLSKILRKYRRVVQILRILPFAYLCVFAALAFSSLFISEKAACLMDGILFVSPAVSAGVFLLSGALGMCSWHKTACMLPYTSRLVSIVDSNIITFTQDEMSVINIVIGSAIILFIALAFNHFLGCTTSNKT